MIFIIVSNIIPIKEYLTMEEVEIKHEKNTAEIDALKKKYAQYQGAVDKAIELTGNNTVNIKSRKTEIGKFICAMNSGEDGNETLKKIYCK